MADFTPRIILFCCSNCAQAVIQTADNIKMALPENVTMVQVPCSGRVDVLHLLKAFEEGADGVLVTGCPSTNCKYISGADKAVKRVDRVRKMLAEITIEPERVELFRYSSIDARRFIEKVEAMVARIGNMGPKILH